MKETKSLRDFFKEENRASCIVCKRIPEALRREIANRPQEVRASTVMKWLRREHGITIKLEEYVAHARVGHDKHLRKGSSGASIRT